MRDGDRSLEPCLAACARTTYREAGYQNTEAKTQRKVFDHKTVSIEAMKADEDRMSQ